MQLSFAEKDLQGRLVFDRDKFHTKQAKCILDLPYDKYRMETEKEVKKETYRD